MAKVSGTFSGTGSSAAVSTAKAVISLFFAGTATVKVQRQVDGTNWRDVESYTASTEIDYDSVAPVPIRLNCSAHTDNVTYAIQTF